MSWKSGFFTSLVALAVGSAFLGGCGPTESSPAPAGGSEPAAGGTAETGAKRPAVTGDGVAFSGETIKIGVIGSQTGDQKPWGDDSIEGARLAVEEFNAAGGYKGKKVELLVGDSQSKAESAKTAADKLLSDGAVAIVGEVASGHTIQIATSAKDKAVPVVAIGATKTDLTDIGNHVFRVCYTDDFQGPLMAKFAYDELGLKKVAVMTDNKQPYSQYLSKTFAEKFKALGGEIVAEASYETGQNQFAGQLTELKAKNPDGLFLSGYFPEVGPIAQQAKAAGLNVKFMGGDGWDSPQLLESGGDAILGAFFCNHYNNKEDRPIVKSFLDKWKAKFGGKEPSTTMGALGYDAMALTLDALKRTTNETSVGILEAIASTENFEGVTGTITLKGTDGNPQKRALVVEVVPLAQGFQAFRKAYEPGELN